MTAAERAYALLHAGQRDSADDRRYIEVYVQVPPGTSRTAVVAALNEGREAWTSARNIRVWVVEQETGLPLGFSVWGGGN
jgi:hypothetical protein